MSAFDLSNKNFSEAYTSAKPPNKSGDSMKKLQEVFETQRKKMITQQKTSCFDNP